MNKKKRANGEGCIYKEKNGTYTVIKTIGYDANGKQLRAKRRGFKKHSEASEFSATWKATPRGTIKDLWETYLITDYLDLSEGKKKHYLTVYERLKPVWHKDIDSLDIKDLQRLIEPYESFYQQKDIKTLMSHLYNIAIAQKMTSVNLTQRMKLVKLEEKQGEPWTVAELQKFWDAYDQGDNFVGYILFMCYTGAQPEEVFGTITRSMIDYNNQVIIGSGVKTEIRRKSPLVLADDIVPVLKDLMKDSVKLWNGSKHQWYDEYRRCIKRCGVRELPPYTCRHTTGTLIANGTPTLIAQKFMRHGSSKTTERYVHPDSETLIKAINSVT